MQKQWQLLCILRNFFESQMEFKTVWKKPYRQYDVLIAKVLSIDICKKKIIYVTIICLPFLQIIVSYSLYNQRLPMSERGAMIWLLNF